MNSVLTALLSFLLLCQVAVCWYVKKVVNRQLKYRHKASHLRTRSLDTEEPQEFFHWDLANTSVWLSAAAYCPFDTILNRTFLGYSEGFVPKSLIYSERLDVQVSVVNYFMLKYYFNSIYTGIHWLSSVSIFHLCGFPRYDLLSGLAD
jgi:hypothetical protein